MQEEVEGAPFKDQLFTGRDLENDRPEADWRPTTSLTSGLYREGESEREGLPSRL